MDDRVSFQRLTVTPTMYAEFGKEHAIAYIGTPWFWSALLVLMDRELERNPGDDGVRWMAAMMKADAGIPLLCDDCKAKEIE